MDQVKQKIIDAIRIAEKDLLDLSHNIHENPELGFEEFKAQGFIAQVLEKYGFQVQKGYGGLETSFRADLRLHEGAPTVAFLAEYDALKGIGHGCGHNLIATCAVGAFLGLATAADSLQGNVCIIGTPAEETGSGKVKMLRAGAFDNVDFALMMHPSSDPSNLVGRGGRAACTVDINFHGKAVHSAFPERGINALTSVLNLFQQIDQSRATLLPYEQISGVITNGGLQANVIPAEASCSFNIRSETMVRVEEMLAQIRRSAEAAAALTGATMDMTCSEIMSERYPNRPMCQAFKDNMAQLGIEMEWPDPKKKYGSSDIGNVSIKLPAIHDYLAITDDPAIQQHTAQYAVVTGSPHAQQVCLKGAMGLAMTGYDILTSADFRKEILDYFHQQVPACYRQ